MATNTLSSTIVHELLRKDNYANWSAWMKNYLLAQDLWDIVEVTTEPPKDEVELKAWRKNNAAALHAIQISCGMDILSTIRGINSAKMVWDKLATLYGSGNSSNILADFVSQIDKLATAYGPGNSTDISVFSAENGSIINDFSQYESLRTAISKGDWDGANEFLSQLEDAKSARISVNGGTVLHVAVFAGDTRIVEELVESMSAEELQIQDDNGLTALAQAAILQNTRMVDCMLTKNTDLLNISDDWNCIPLVTALEYRNIEMARHLYFVSQTISGIDASTVLHLFILRNNFDLALHLLQRCPDSAIVPNKYDASPLVALASKSYAFPSGSQLGFWKKWIYAYISIRSAHFTSEIQIKIHSPNEHQSDQVKVIRSVQGLLCRLLSNLLKLLGIKQICELKLLHHQACKLLQQMCSEVKQMNSNAINEASVLAIKGGINEFIDEIVKIDSQLLCNTDAMGRDTFFSAVLHRQDKIVRFINSLPEKNSITNARDKSGSTILHMAAMLEPSTTRDRIAGEALKMQSELELFKEVGKICSKGINEIRNDANMTPRELFTYSHKSMMTKGEKWMKTVATSCTVVGALIITIMFTAAFTVPGGNNQNTGFPMFSHKNLFTAFIISDALSLISSSTSVLVFLGILTSRYAEEDFLISLPTKMIIGLFTLFFSIATMMIAFCTGLYIMLPEKSTMVIPITCLASVPVIQFGFMHIPLLFDMSKSTFKVWTGSLYW